MILVDSFHKKKKLFLNPDYFYYVLIIILTFYININLTFYIHIKYMYIHYSLLVVKPVIQIHFFLVLIYIFGSMEDQAKELPCLAVINGSLHN